MSTIADEHARQESAGTPLIELLDERRHLLAIASETLGSASQADDALQRVYRLWFELEPGERAHIQPVRPWLTRLLERECSAVVPTAPTASDIRPPGVASAPPPDDRGDEGGIVHTFAVACQTDDALALDAVLAPSVTALVDCGGKLRVDPSPVHGVDDVSRFLRSLFGRQPELAMTAQPVNATAGLVVRHLTEVVAVVILDIIDIVDDAVEQVCVVLNPDKLRGWNRG